MIVLQSDGGRWGQIPDRSETKGSKEQAAAGDR